MQAVYNLIAFLLMLIILIVLSPLALYYMLQEAK